MNHLSPAEVLHQAQSDAIARLTSRDWFTNPRLWAGFVLQSATGFAVGNFD